MSRSAIIGTALFGITVATGIAVASFGFARSSRTSLNAYYYPEPSPIAARIEYFALGDSVASGHGLYDDSSSCRRSRRAYPDRVALRLGVRYAAVAFHDFACSGATASPNRDVGDDPYKWLGNQVADARKQMRGMRPETRVLVSITAGANDFPWAQYPFTEMRQRLCRDDDREFQRWLTLTVSDVERRLSGWVRFLLERPNTFVVLTEYYNPFNAQSVFPLDWPALRCDGQRAYRRTEQGVHALNEAYGRIEKDLSSRTALAKVHDAFHGHEAPRQDCGRAAPDVSDTWIQYLSDPLSTSNPGDLGLYRGDCFHPNDSGAAKLGNAVYDAAQSLGL